MNQAGGPMTVMEVIDARRSVRTFTGCKIGRLTVNRLLAAAVRAPTAMHEEPWAFVVVQDVDTLKQLSDAQRQFNGTGSSVLGVVLLPRARQHRLRGRGRWPVVDGRHDSAATSPESASAESVQVATANVAPGSSEDLGGRSRRGPLRRSASGTQSIASRSDASSCAE